MLLRIALPEPTPQALERVARVTRTLGAGEVLAVWSAGGWPVDDLAALDDRLRVAECRFGTGDRETFVWAAPPEPPAPAPGGVIDVRALPPPLPLVVTALAVAALPAGEAVSVTGARRSPLLADLLGGRADVSEGPPTDQGAAVTRITRR